MNTKNCLDCGNKLDWERCLKCQKEEINSDPFPKETFLIKDNGSVISDERWEVHSKRLPNSPSFRIATACSLEYAISIMAALNHRHDGKKAVATLGYIAELYGDCSCDCVDCITCIAKRGLKCD